MNRNLSDSAYYIVSLYFKYEKLCWYNYLHSLDFFYVAMTVIMTEELHRCLSKENRLDFLENNNIVTCLNCGSGFFKDGEICRCYDEVNEPYNYIFSINLEQFSDFEKIAEKAKRNVKAKKAKINRLKLEREVEGFYTENDLKVLYIIQKGLCYYCRTPIGKIKNKYTIDHVIPLSDGGTNWPLNLALACKSCNSRKSWTSESRYLKKIRDELSEDDRKNHKEFVSNIRKLKRKIFKQI